MTRRLFPFAEDLSQVIVSGSVPQVNTISEVLMLVEVGTKINAVSVLDENTIYIYNASASNGDFQDTVHGGYWSSIASSGSSESNQLTFEIATPETIVLTDIPNNVVILRIILNVTQVFQNGVQIQVGDTFAPARLMLHTENKPTKMGAYMTSPNIAYKNITGLGYKLKVTFLNSTLMVGACTLTVEYSNIKAI